MALTQTSFTCPYITINNIQIPLKPFSPEESFLPSSETIQAWYLAYYGTSNLLELEPKIAATSLEKLARWWVEIKSEILDRKYVSVRSQQFYSSIFSQIKVA
ncbi:MAG TPA: hypothetical protein DCF68_18550 [Cyanothece sp. UBA12306]|nr:hypothetical protein [Cyanothece sp. UBA12306]